MPEGPEVRKYADALDAVLRGRAVTLLEARTRAARAWLKDHEWRLLGRRVTRVMSHGKHLLGYIEGDLFFHSHLMMWGRWQTFGRANSGKEKSTKVAEALVLPERGRLERARIVVNEGAAILLSAPIFNLGEGNPYDQIEILATLGPDVLPYDKAFDGPEFRRRLLLAEHLDLPIGALLLNQRVVAGLGNYLRAEVLFACKLNPWRRVGDLAEKNLQSLIRAVPQMASRAYERGATARVKDRKRMAGDPSLVYQPGREYGTRHLVFRRTNLPCLRCGETIRQSRLKTHSPEQAAHQEERTRIVYFCPKCQRVKIQEIEMKSLRRAPGGDVE